MQTPWTTLANAVLYSSRWQTKYLLVGGGVFVDNFKEKALHTHRRCRSLLSVVDILIKFMMIAAAQKDNLTSRRLHMHSLDWILLHVCVRVFTCVASYGGSELVVFIPNLLLVPVVCCLPSPSPSSAQNQSQQKAITHQARDLFTILNYLSLRLNYIYMPASTLGYTWVKRLWLCNKVCLLAVTVTIASLRISTVCESLKCCKWYDLCQSRRWSHSLSDILQHWCKRYAVKRVLIVMFVNVSR